MPRRLGSARTERIAAVRVLRLTLAAARRRRWRLAGWAAALLWMAGPLQAFLSGVDPAVPASAQDGAGWCRQLRYVLGIAGFVVAATHPERLLRLARAAWPLLALLAYAALSLAWSRDPAASARALAAGSPMLAVAAALAVDQRPARLFLALALALAAMVLASLLAVVAIPHFAVAGAHDAAGASRAGDWRGVFQHKNTLGHVAGLTAGLLASRPGRLLAPRAFRWGALAAALACLAGARSASGVALALALPVLEPILRTGGAVRLATVGFALAAAAALFAARAWWLGAGLELLGRDATISGRTAIWRTAGELAGRRRWSGWGLDYSVSPAVAHRLQLLFGVNHVHNAGLDVFIDLGGLGLVLAAGAVAGGMRLARGGGAAGRGLLLLVLGWLLSGLSEDMGVRAEGPLMEIGLVALVGLYALAAGRRSFRRPPFGFRRPWPAPLRPPRLGRGA